MRPHVIAVLVCALFILGALSPSMAAPEDEEIPSLMIKFEDREYDVGERLNVTIEVRVNGILTNADLNSMVLAVIWNFTFGQGQPADVLWFFEVHPDPAYRIERVDTGLYELDLIIEPEHVTRMMPVGEGLPIMSQVVVMMAMCDYGGTTDPVTARTMAMALVEDGPSMQVTVETPFPSPGEEVPIRIETTNGTNVDAADVRVNLTSYDGEDHVDLEDLTVTRQSKGVYTATYTVPVGLDVATMYTVNAGASFADYNDSIYLQPFFPSGFMVNFFDIWVQNVSSTDDGTEVAVWVADLDGTALQGIDVEVRVGVYDGSSTTEHDLANTTDSLGRAGFTISHPSAVRVDIAGNVTDGTYRQSLYMEGIIDNSPPEPPEHDGDDEFYVEAWQMPETNIFDSVKHPGDTITSMYRAFNTSGALASKRINWMLVDRDGFFDANYTVVDSGYEVTDANGDLEISYELPSNDVNAWIMFQAVSWSDEEGEYVSMESTTALIDAGFFPVDESIELSVDRVHKDRPVELRAQVPLPASYFIGHMFAVVDEDEGTQRWGQPLALGPEADDFPIVPLRKLGSDIFGVDKQLPEFFPEDQSAAFMVMSVDLEAFRIRTNYVILEYGESTNKGVDATVTGPDPINAGDAGTVEVRVDNTGQGTDTYGIEQVSGPEWLEWDEGEVTLEPSETGSLSGNVTVPTDADEDVYYINVTVRSVDDPTTNVTRELMVEVLVNGVNLTAEPDEGTAFRERTVNFVVAVNNTGQGNDTYDLDLAGAAAGWATLSDGTVTVPEGGETEVVVQVDVPGDADQDSYTVNVTATSSDGVTSDAVSLTVHVLVNGVDVGADEESVETWPGLPVPYTFDVTNTGQGADTFTLTLDGSAANWSDLTPGELTLGEGESDTVVVESTPPGDVDMDDYELVLVATSTDGVTNSTASTVVRVWVTGVALDVDDEAKEGRRGEMVVFTMTVANTGQGRDVFTLSHEWADWAELVTFGSNPVAIDGGADGEVELTITLPDDIDQGTYDIKVTATSQDAVTNASLELAVSVTVNDVDISLSSTTEKVTKGDSVEVTLNITNTGQGPDTFTVLLAGAASNWTEADRNVVTVDEGKTAQVTLTITVPGDADAKDAFLDVTVVSEDPQVSTQTQFLVVVEEKEEPSGFFLTATIIIVLIVAVIVIVFAYILARGPE